MLKRTNGMRPLAGALIAAAVTMAGAVPALSEQVAKLSYHWGPKHPAAGFADEFAKRVTERSGGELTIQVFPSGQLFGIRDVLGGVSSGAVDIGMAVGIVSFPPLNKNYDVATLPGVFSGFDQIRGFFADTEAGQAIIGDIESSAGIKIIGYDPVGPSAVFTTRENVTSIDDYEGVNARVLADSDRMRWRALNAGRMVSLPTGEVYSALQSGMVDTVATVPGAVKSYSWWDYVKSAQLPYFQFNDAYFIANQAWLDSLSPEMKDLVMEVAAEVSVESTDAIMAASNATLEEFKEHGGTVVTFEGAELERLTTLEVEQVLPSMQDLVDKDVVDAALAYTRSQ